MNIQEMTSSCEAWITFSCHENAFKANFEVGIVKVCGSAIKGALCNHALIH